jgi:hypothetical protein
MALNPPKKLQAAVADMCGLSNVSSDTACLKGSA